MCVLCMRFTTLLLSVQLGLPLAGCARPTTHAETLRDPVMRRGPSVDNARLHRSRPRTLTQKQFELGTYRTSLARSSSGRATNVRQAARALHGATVPAGGTLSFNEQIGPRTYRRGYRSAPVIANGEVTQGLGGGVCQVSSTLYAAAYFAGLSFDKHQPHSRPSHYIPAGLDAAVAWPRGDLVVENPFSFPVLIEAWVTEDLLTVTLWGEGQPRRVTVSRRVRRGKPHEERVESDPAMRAGRRRVTQRGRPGRVVRRVRTITEGERLWRESDRIVYPPVTEIVHVGSRSEG